MNQRFTLAQAIEQALEHTLGERIHTAFPAAVIQYDALTCKASVQPSIKELYLDGTTIELPAIVEVPVIWPRTANAIIHLPLAPDDTVLCVICERSIDQWIQQGGKGIDPGMTRKFHLTDAVALPGLFPVTRQSGVINNSAITIKIENNGTVIIEGGTIKLGESALLGLTTENGFLNINTALTAIALYINTIVPGTVVWPAVLPGNITTKVKAE